MTLPPNAQASPDAAPPRLLPNPLHESHVRVDAEFQPYEAVEIVSTFGEPQAEYAALHKACGLIDLAHRGVLELTGKDRLQFLNNLLTNELWFKATKTGLAAGEGRYAFLLGTNGRIVGDMNVLERGDRLFLEMDARMVEPIRKALDRYLFADQVKLIDRVGALHELALHGPGAPAVLDAAVGSHITELPPLGSTQVVLFDTDVTVWRDDVCGAPGLHLLVPADQVGHVWSTLVGRFGELVAHARRPLRPVGWAAFNTVRIEAGRPLFGIDFDSTIVPAETGGETFARAVNVAKGCYVGQEIVKKAFFADGATVQVPAEGAMRKATVQTNLRFVPAPT
jgi:aminomethyltransferase